MSQAVEGTHTTAVSEVRRHHRHQTLVRTELRAPRRVMRRRSHRSLTPMVLLIAIGLIMIAAPVYVLLGAKAIAVSPSLWQVAADICRVVTGLIGLLMIASVVIERRSESDGDSRFSAVVGGVLCIAAAVLGLRLVIVITGLGGLILLYGGGALAHDALRSSRGEPRP